MKGKHIAVILTTFFVLLGVVFSVYHYRTLKETHVTLPTLGNPGHKINNFSFINQEGKTITQDDVIGKIYVVESFFTSCMGICPKLNEQMSRVAKAYHANADVKLLSLTVDPKRDSVATLKNHSLQFEVDPNQWWFLTGDKQALYDAIRNDFLLAAKETEDTLSIDKDFIHSEYFILVDQKGRIRGKYSGLVPGEVNQLIGDIQLVINEGKKES